MNIEKLEEELKRIDEEVENKCRIITDLRNSRWTYVKFIRLYIR